MGNQIYQGIRGITKRGGNNRNSTPSFVETDNISKGKKTKKKDRKESNTDPGTGDSGYTSDGPRSPPPVPPKPAKVKVKALYTFPGASDDDLAFKKGDIMEVDENIITGQDEWWTARHLKTGKEGFIPSNYVIKDDQTPQSQDWWFEFDRHEADKVLHLPGNKRGTFLIRQATDKLTYVISVLDYDKDTSEPVAKHYRIKTLDNGGFYISTSRTFADLFELVTFYSAKNATGLCCPLTTACPRIRPNLQFRELEVKRDAINLSTKLGQGCFGEVWRGKFRKVVDVAVKTLKKGTMSAEEFLEEAKIMHKLTHPRLVQLMAVVSTSEPFYIITELMPHGALLEFLRSDKGKKLKFKQMIDINAQIADGMAYLEHMKYIHRDLRAANVLVGEHYDVKVADFGLARILQGDEYKANINVKFPIKWTAPEAANERKFSTKSDVWSFGVLMAEIATHGKTPYPAQSGQEVLKMVDRGERMPKPSNHAFDIPDSYYEMMLKCWNQNPEERPTFESLHDFFDTYFIHTEPQYKDMEDD